MLTFVAPFIVYLISFPVMFITLFRVEIGLVFFISLVPIIAVMKKISEFPGGNNFADFLLIALVIGWFLKARWEGKRFFERSPVNLAVILMILGSVVNLIWGYTSMSFPDDINLIRLMTWKNYMILPLIYFIAINNIHKENLVKWIIVFICFTMLATDFNFHGTFRHMSSYHYRHSIKLTFFSYDLKSF